MANNAGHTFKKRVGNPDPRTGDFQTETYQAAAGLSSCNECHGMGAHSSACSQSGLRGHAFAYTTIVDGKPVAMAGSVGETVKRAPCAECGAVGAHSRDCRLASHGHTFKHATVNPRTGEPVWHEGTVGTPARKAFDAPPQNKMVEAPTRKKSDF